MLNFLRSLFSGKSNHPAHIVARRAFCEELERRRLLSDGPVVLASEAYFQTAPNELRFRFSQNVADSLGTNDLVLRNVLTGKIEDADAAVLSYDSNTNTAMFRFTKFENSVFPDGDYLATLSATGITNSNGDDLQGDHDFDFFFWTADANHDRDVNLTDFNIMAAHFGLPATYGEGDFSFDGQVNLMDFNILAGRFGTSLAEPAGPGEISVTAISSNSVRLQWSTAGVSGEDGWRLQVSTDGQNFFFLRNLPPGTSTHEVTLLQDGTRYWFRVRAYGNDQDTAYSPKKAATTVLLGATDLEAVEFGPTTARLTWANQSVTADGIQVFRSDNGGTTWIPAGTAGANETSFDATISSWTANPLFKIRAFRGNPSDPDVESADTLCGTRCAGDTDGDAARVRQPRDRDGNHRGDERTGQHTARRIVPHVHLVGHVRADRCAAGDLQRQRHERGKKHHRDVLSSRRVRTLGDDCEWN